MMEILRTKMLFLTTRIASAGSVVLAIMAALAPDTKSFRAEFIAIMAILKANPYVLEVTEDIIHFSASFKSSFWDRLQNGMKPPDIFRELGI
ncbi:MAG: hypothetical protein K6F61_06105, partial [Clostridiales bacterium]|nr:hypothetical protein [Clostridiales bacterium]